MKRYSDHKLFLVLAAVVTLVVAAAYLSMSYAVSGAVARAVVSRDQAAAAAAGKDQEQDVAALYQSTASDRARVEGMFIPSGDAVAFIESLEALGPKAGSAVSLSAIGADSLDAAAPGTIGAIHAHIAAHGSWSSVMRTLELAEVMPYPTALNGVRLDVSVLSGDKSASRDWTLGFDISAPLIASSSPTQ